MNKEGLIAIFDMDGTLYTFDRSLQATFSTSRFYRDMKERSYNFLMDVGQLDRDTAIAEFRRLSETYMGEVSLGVEKEYGIDRYTYFSDTWGNLDPQQYIAPDDKLRETMSVLKGRIALLTAAPRVWAVKVLAHLHVGDIFGRAVYTGEPDLRKPDPKIFQKITQDFGVSPTVVFSIGDQEESDILPAQQIGMRTIHITQKPSRADYSARDIQMAVQILQKEGI